jgi:hypothetical protein
VRLQRLLSRVKVLGGGRAEPALLKNLNTRCYWLCVIHNSTGGELHDDNAVDNIKLAFVL